VTHPDELPTTAPPKLSICKFTGLSSTILPVPGDWQATQTRRLKCTCPMGIPILGSTVGSIARTLAVCPKVESASTSDRKARRLAFARKRQKVKNGCGHQRRNVISGSRR